MTKKRYYSKRYGLRTTFFNIVTFAEQNLEFPKWGKKWPYFFFSQAFFFSWSFQSIFGQDWLNLQLHGIWQYFKYSMYR